MTPDARRIVVVLGMHRSGTSVVTRSLPVLGVSLGDRLMPAAQSNARGFWEDLDVVAINEELLAAIGRTWHDASPIAVDSLERLRGTDVERRAVELLRKRTEGGVTYGMKDPRIATVLPFWRAVFRAAELEPSFVIALRDPDLAAASLARRNGTPAAWGHWLWIGHTLAALEGSEGAPRVVVPMEEMVSAPEECVRRLGHALGLPVHEPALAEFVREFVDRRLVHEAGPFEGAWAAQCPALAREMFDSLAAIASAATVADLSPGTIERWRREAGGALGLVRMVELQGRCGNDGEDDRVARAVLADSVAHLQRRIAELSPGPRTQAVLTGRAATAMPHSAGTAVNADGAPDGYPIRRRVRRAMHAARILLNTSRGGIVDVDWYLSENPDVRARGIGARLHFALHGAFEGRAPNPRFRPAEYLAHRPDVAARGMPAALHFALWGFRETAVPSSPLAPPAEAPAPESLPIDGESAFLPAAAAAPAEIRRIARQESVLLRSRGSAFGERVYLCLRGRRRLVASADRILELGLRWPADVRDVPSEVLGAFAPGGDVPRLRDPADGAIDVSGATQVTTVREAMAACLSGQGLGIGPGAASFPVPLSCSVLFGDRLDRREPVCQDRNAGPADAVARPDIEADLDALLPMREGTLDFVVACHVLERTRDPIGAIERARRLLRPGGRLLLVVPDKHRTRDRHRPLTALEHLVQDFRHPDRNRDFPHYVEHFTFAFPVAPEVREEAARSSFERQDAIHCHVWDHSSFRQMLRWIQGSPGRWSGVWTHPPVGDPSSSQEFFAMLTR